MIFRHKKLYLRCELDRRMMFSRNVFCGATRPRRPPGILTMTSHKYQRRLPKIYEALDQRWRQLLTITCRNHVCTVIEHVSRSLMKISHS